MNEEEVKAVVTGVLGELLAPIIEKMAGIEQRVEAQKAETESALDSIVREGVFPIAEQVGLMAKQTRQEEDKKKKDEEEKEKTAPSASVQNWLDDKKTGGLGGKDLFGVTPHNANPKPRTDEKTV